MIYSNFNILNVKNMLYVCKQTRAGSVKLACLIVTQFSEKNRRNQNNFGSKNTFFSKILFFNKNE